MDEETDSRIHGENMNAIQALHIRKQGKLWVFDDQEKKIKNEPFVSGIPDMINVFTGEALEADLIFSKQEFPESSQVELVKLEHGGAWYSGSLLGQDYRGWICPVLYKYFEPVPEKLYFKVVV
jgi:hypothetical protein